MLKLFINVVVLFIFTVVIGFISILAYKEGYTNGNRDGSLNTAQYVAQACHKGGELKVFGTSYHCQRLAEL